MPRSNLKVEEILNKLSSLKNEKNRKGMARFGINIEKAFGISMPLLRDLAKQTGKDHNLALELWRSGYHEARILAALIDEPDSVTEKQMDKWVKDFDSWDLCDQCCGKLFDKTPFAYLKAFEWSRRKEEYVKRAGFVMMASLAVHDKIADDSRFIKFLIIIKGSDDERNFVRKAVNWALRQIGKRNKYLNKEAVKTAHEISKKGSKSAKWIAADALKELISTPV
ncbi:MAG: DNA alkylation repair protein [Ignavibacteria bacterium]